MPAMTVAVLAALFSICVLAAPLPPAPTNGPDKDVDGRLLPFARQSRLPPETPAGSGHHKAIMATAAGLPAHVIYHPADLPKAGELPMFQARQDGTARPGTCGQADGGFFGTLAVAWLDWQLKGNNCAGRMFTGADCALCQDKSWHVFQARIN